MTQWLQSHDDVRQQLSVDYDAAKVLCLPSIWLPSFLTFRLFNYPQELILLQLSFDEEDEQTDILRNTTTFIEKQQQKKHG